LFPHPTIIRDPQAGKLLLTGGVSSVVNVK